MESGVAVGRPEDAAACALGVSRCLRAGAAAPACVYSYSTVLSGLCCVYRMYVLYTSSDLQWPRSVYSVVRWTEAGAWVISSP